MSTKSLLSQELLNNKSALKSILVNNENRLAKSPSICVEDYSSIRNNTCREIKKKKRKPAKCGVIKFNGQSGFLNGQKMFDYKNYLKIQNNESYNKFIQKKLNCNFVRSDLSCKSGENSVVKEWVGCDKKNLNKSKK